MERENRSAVPRTLPSLFDTLKPAVGPSSSHTLGPMRAGLLFRRRLEEQSDIHPGERITITLYGSLAYTGKGHLTDQAIVAGLCGYGPEDLENRSMVELYTETARAGELLLSAGGVAFQPEHDIVFDTKTPPAPHPNTLRFTLLDWQKHVLLSVTYCSIGGGAVVESSDLGRLSGSTSAHKVSAHDIIQACQQREETLVDYAFLMEASVHGHARDAVLDHLCVVWRLMSLAIERGLSSEGYLPGVLRVERRAADMMRRLTLQHGTPGVISADSTRASIYAIAVAEENAAGGAVVTAPTCGSAGVLPSCLRVMQESMKLSDDRIGEALLVASVIGELAIAKASIAGALVGCQGEIGVASAMAAAAVCYLLGGSVFDQVNRAAETALEHFLGLTCDPVAGLVQIPCIERNAVGAASALNAANMAMISGGRARVGFDATLEVMHQTGLDMRSRYKETSLGGLAAVPDLDSDGIPDDQQRQ
ncbi:L-serine ammonia-lyase [Candidatus Bipolaricaulota bacterium]|nr:L-serine ammonia-lyase [Candidatus Bipolaricaulota bacterium]